MTIENRIGFIKALYPFQFLWPLGISVCLAYIIPIINEKITFLQSKPISRTAVILAIRRKRALVADISVEKYRAKRDITYERYVAGSEKEIQNMREEILVSQERMGQINDERDRLTQSVTTLETALKAANTIAEKHEKDAKNLKQTVVTQDKKMTGMQERIDALTKAQSVYGLGLPHGLQGFNTLIKPEGDNLKFGEGKLVLTKKDK